MKKRASIMALAACLLLTGCGVKDKLDLLLGRGQTETETEIQAPESETEAATEPAESETAPLQAHEKDYSKKDLEGAPIGIVNQKNVNFRVRPASNTATKTKLKKGEELRLLEQVDDEDGYTWWYAERVSMKGVRGYVGAELVDIQEGTYQLKDFDEGTLTAVILENNVNIRKKADVKSDRVACLKKGETVALIDQEYTDDHTWWHIKMKNGKKGYVVADYILVQGEPDTEVLSTDSSATNPVAFVSGDYVNLREKASTQSGILKKLLKGTRVEVLSRKEGTDYLWLRVRTQDDTVGYVAANYMTFENESETETPRVKSSEAKPMAFVSGDYVTLREKASAQSTGLKKLLKGTRVQVLGREEGGDYLWLHVKTEDNQVGYVAAKYMTFEGGSQ